MLKHSTVVEVVGVVVVVVVVASVVVEVVVGGGVQGQFRSHASISWCQ